MLKGANILLEFAGSSLSGNGEKSTSTILPDNSFSLTPLTIINVTSVTSTTLRSNEFHLITINISAQAPLKLTTTNYMSWKIQFQTLLTGYDLLGFVDGFKPCPPTTMTINDISTPNPAHNIWPLPTPISIHPTFLAHRTVVTPKLRARILVAARFVEFKAIRPRGVPFFKWSLFNHLDQAQYRHIPLLRFRGSQELIILPMLLPTTQLGYLTVGLHIM
ncbi:hypothetical protein Ddye_015309 [Dipteronia dyeriana]|uniref:Retrotransposon Copia-like N-terminal domain-containing protein n=1 Tax=Dipteronia dyeriana TaxID=168575 RepID=A0AAD9WZF3_9ROSI|nr:hypothetical protein Ddye_015309 [Dipteronia dyeriana]